MALARIITRSQVCSRQLAIDLLARGYAVEIVSPDAIPDNLADLELRVEEEPGNQLVASVEARNGDRSASLDFLHHLKAPMGEFIRRFPEPAELDRFSEEPGRFNAQQSFEVLELPANPRSAPEAVSPSAAVLVEPALDLVSAKPETAPLVLVPEPPPSLPVETPRHFTAAPATMAVPKAIRKALPKTVLKINLPKIAPPIIAATQEIVRFVRTRQWKIRPSGWFWSAGLTFAGLVTLALILGFGLRRTDNSFTPADNISAASTDVNAIGTLDKREDLRSPTSTSVPVQKEPPGSSAALATAAPSASTRAKREPRREVDVVAPNTVTYLDKRFAPHDVAKSAQPKAEKSVTSHHPSSRKRRSDVIAANKVTYLDKPTRKTTK